MASHTLSPVRGDPAVLERAQGCLLGQLCGDALGSLVEFGEAAAIRKQYPHGLRLLADGGVWNTIAGQPTDDSEMALALAHCLLRLGRYDVEEVKAAYVAWLQSDPFDCGGTVSSGLMGQHNPQSQANGALMRISPLGIFGANHDLQQVAEWARRDAAITHIHPICLQVNALFAMAIAHTIRNGGDGTGLYDQIKSWAASPTAHTEPQLLDVIEAAATERPLYSEKQGWVLIAFQNALWQLVNAPNLEEAVVDTVMQGGDTDTNGAICGALLGAVWGREAVPAQWARCLQDCRPLAGQTNVLRPRPQCYWPVDAPELASQLLAAG